MPKGPRLSADEMISIDAFHAAGLSNLKIGEHLGRSEKVVRNYLRDPEEYRRQKHPGKQKKISPQSTRRLIRAANEGKESASQLAERLELPIGKRQVCRILSNCPHLKYEKRNHAPVLTDRHKEARVQCATRYMNRNEVWLKTIFSDEKKFNLDGPDCLQFYWHDLRTEKQWFKTRQSGGGSIMIWAAFSRRGKSQMAILEGNQNSEMYVNTIRRYLLPFARDLYEEDYIFQQDNAAIHSSRYTEAELRGLNIDIMDWPSKSPDLNPIENLWGILVREVYANGKQYDDKTALKNAILAAWDNIQLSTLEKLVDSMNRRCCEVIRLNGNKIKY